MGKKKRTKSRTHVEMGSNEQVDETTGDKIPRSFVLRRGKADRNVIELVQNMRLVMSPNTALRLKERRSNQLKDFVHVAGPLGVSHMLLFSQTDVGTNLRIGRMPRGPTLSFRVQAFSLMKDIVAIQKRPHPPASEYKNSPLVVLNNFSGDAVEKKLMATMFQNMYPPINVANMQLKDCRRVVLFNYVPDEGVVHMRHYIVTASPVGITKSIKKIVKAKIPNLSNYEDISQYVFNPPNLSDSEAEDTPETRVTLAQNFVGRGNKKAGTSAIRLKELGPRMTLKLMKIEEGFCEGRVLYHSIVQKTSEQVRKLEKEQKKKQELKKLRQAEQDANVKRKQEQKEQSKQQQRVKQQQQQLGAADPVAAKRKTVSFDADADADADAESSSDDGDDEDEDEKVHAPQRQQQLQKQKQTDDDDDIIYDDDDEDEEDAAGAAASAGAGAGASMASMLAYGGQEDDDVYGQSSDDDDDDDDDEDEDGGMREEDEDEDAIAPSKQESKKNATHKPSKAHSSASAASATGTGTGSGTGTVGSKRHRHNLQRRERVVGGGGKGASGSRSDPKGVKKRKKQKQQKKSQHG